MKFTVNKESDLLLKLNGIVIPEALENTVLQLAHVGHLGITKTKTPRSKVYFPKVDEKTERLIKYCAACQIRTKPVLPAKLSIPKTARAVWETTNINYLGPLPNEYYYRARRSIVEISDCRSHMQHFGRPAHQFSSSDNRYILNPTHHHIWQWSTLQILHLKKSFNSGLNTNASRRFCRKSTRKLKASWNL